MKKTERKSKEEKEFILTKNLPQFAANKKSLGRRHKKPRGIERHAPYYKEIFIYLYI
jgi:hypothetical protein